MDSGSRKAIEFVNIGIVGKNIGTVSNTNGVFEISVDKEMDIDTLLFSAIGYEPRLRRIADLRVRRGNKI